jgi:hypothetical protein
LLRNEQFLPKEFEIQNKQNRTWMEKMCVCGGGASVAYRVFICALVLFGFESGAPWRKSLAVE